MSHSLPCVICYVSKVKSSRCAERGAARVYTCRVRGPRQHDDAGHGANAAEVDHPDGLLDVEVVEDGAAVDAVVARAAVDRPRRVSAHPLLRGGVPLVLATIVDERLLLERKVLH